jgi:hypothetical protein
MRHFYPKDVVQYNDCICHLNLSMDDELIKYFQSLYDSHLKNLVVSSRPTLGQYSGSWWHKNPDFEKQLSAIVQTGTKQIDKKTLFRLEHEWIPHSFKEAMRIAFGQPEATDLLFLYSTMPSRSWQPPTCEYTYACIEFLIDPVLLDCKFHNLDCSVAVDSGMLVGRGQLLNKNVWHSYWNHSQLPARTVTVCRKIRDAREIQVIASHVRSQLTILEPTIKLKWF